MKARVIEIQVAGRKVCESLSDACDWWMIEEPLERPKMHFTIQLPFGELRHITIRDEGGETVAYGDFEGLPSSLDYAEDVRQERISQTKGVCQEDAS